MNSQDASQSVTESTASRHFIEGVIGFIAGSLGGSASVFVGQPLDTVKVKLQTFPHLYNNGLQCFKKTLKNEGFFRGLYAGTFPALAANIAENSVLFCAHGFCQKGVTYLSGNEGAPKPLENAIAGFFAAFFSSFTLCPTELIKCRLQSLKETGQSGKVTAFGMTRQILKDEGLIGMFRGLTPTFAREMPGYFFFFGGYEFSRHLLTDGKPETAGLLTTVTAGGFGGLCLWTSIFPFDVAKSRMQIEPTDESMSKVMIRIYRTNGFRALYKGLGPTLLRTFPATGALFVAVEYSKSFMSSGAHSIGWL
ncbi:mitochondrial ornithine transporter 1 [Tetranychus urticae]|nr:mitochondrial ornithine transporter 1 [Tetranychus urticae]XP_015782130.1 mitochondrial ornithine transporter 1 [Tetranychus urticae]XP_015782131.1 mitochondrial ornithine transporter 1 [Tetranychus urticae]XP_025016141.1 mitochondrial ornithine transporter 1 [Tetranychus urticae]XP_025016142.1 mitochondrial ornithine transporter 1 [Tetranychus urticae]XP_025016143.1 mitochondrial ornithine transporter 1 [Tetranychus urticae]